MCVSLARVGELATKRVACFFFFFYFFFLSLSIYLVPLRFAMAVWIHGDTKRLALEGKRGRGRGGGGGGCGGRGALNVALRPAPRVSINSYQLDAAARVRQRGRDPELRCALLPERKQESRRWDG